MIGRGSAGFETIVALVDRLPAMVCPRWVGVRTQPIAIVDVIEYLAGVCGLPQAIGASFDIGGPDVMTYREMIERVGAERGKRPLIVEVPVLTPRLSSYWLHLVTPVKASVARPLIEGLRNETVAKDERIRELLPRRAHAVRRSGASSARRLIGASATALLNSSEPFAEDGALVLDVDMTSAIGRRAQAERVCERDSQRHHRKRARVRLAERGRIARFYREPRSAASR